MSELEEKLRKENPLAYIFRERIISKLQEREKEELSKDSMIPRTVGSYAVIVRTPKERLAEVVEEVAREILLNRCPFCGVTRETDSSLADHIITNHFDKEPNEIGEWVIES